MRQKVKEWRRLIRAACLLSMAGILAVAGGAMFARPVTSKDTVGEKTPAQGSRPKKSGDLVAVRGKAARPGPDGKRVVTLTVTIAKDWHIYANPVPRDFSGTPTTVTFALKGKALPAKVFYPKGKLVQDPDGAYRIYEGTVKISAVVDQPKGVAAPLEVRVQLQTCNSVKQTCLPPGTIQLRVP